LDYLPLGVFSSERCWRLGWPKSTVLAPIAISRGYPADALQQHGAIQVKLPPIHMGLNGMASFLVLVFVLSFGYWCTNFLIVQRAFAAESKAAARESPSYWRDC